MNSISLIVGAFAGLWALTMALGGAVWAQMLARLRSAEARLYALESQNTTQETKIGRLSERVRSAVGLGDD